MTRKQLKGRWLKEIQDMTPDVYIPDQYALLSEAVREAISPCGGIKRTATLTTVAGQKYCGTAEGFPVDFLSVYRIYNASTGVPLNPMPFRERDEAASAASDPSYYTLWGNKVYLGPTPASVITLKMDYFGSGDDAAGDTTVLLADVPGITDNDGFWDVPVFYAAMVYYRIRKDGDSFAAYKKLFHAARWEARKRILSLNKDRHQLSSLPEGYFGGSDAHSFVERASEDGDIIRTY